jgi:hypothetical protein
MDLAQDNDVVHTLTPDRSDQDATMQPAPQDNQLMSKHRVLSLKFDLSGEARTARTKQNSPIIPPA